jgi:putative ABC transport system permease protein
VFNVERETLFLNLGATGIVAFIAAIVPTRRAIQIRIADGLRRIG